MKTEPLWAQHELTLPPTLSLPKTPGYVKQLIRQCAETSEAHGTFNTRLVINCSIAQSEQLARSWGGVQRLLFKLAERHHDFRLVLCSPKSHK